MKISAWLAGSLTVFCFVLGLSFSARSENRNPNYLVLKGGLYSPQNEKLYVFDSGFNDELAWGRYINKNLALETDINLNEVQATFNLGFLF
jgi:hypothetical protein